MLKRDPQPPSLTVTVNKVEEALKAGLTPCLFIDELDKFKLDSTFQLNEFSSIIDAIQANNGQVVATTNLTAMALTRAMGEQHGPAIMRRLTGPRMNNDNPENPTDPSKGGFLVDCDKGKITQNYWTDIASNAMVAKTTKADGGTTTKTEVRTTKSGVTTAVPSPKKGSGSGKSASQNKKKFADNETNQEQNAPAPAPKQRGRGTVAFRGPR